MLLDRGPLSASPKRLKDSPAQRRASLADLREEQRERFYTQLLTTTKKLQEITPDEVTELFKDPKNDAVTALSVYVTPKTCECAGGLG